VWYINSEGDAFNLVDVKSIIEDRSRILAEYVLDEAKVCIESIDNRKIAKQFISWLVYRIATDESFFCYEDFKELEGRLDAAKALKEHKGRLDTVKVTEVG